MYSKTSDPMLTEIMGKGAMLRERGRDVDRLVRVAVDHAACLSARQIYVFGCGDSYYAALSTRMAFEQLTGLPAAALTAMDFARYTTAHLRTPAPRMALAIGVSVSGEVARTIEGLALARQAGAATVAVTGTPGSRLAGAADITVAVDVPVAGHPPGVRTYLASQLTLYLLAVRIGEVRGHLSSTAAEEARTALWSIAQMLEATHPEAQREAAGVAAAIKDRAPLTFVGYGPNYGTALFGAAKVIEAVGLPALGQDLEEWAHVQYFVRQQGPTVLVAPPGWGYGRAAELVEVMRRVGATVIGVVGTDDAAVAGSCEHRFVIRGQVAEVFSPLLYASPLELLAAHLAADLEEPHFRGFAPPRVLDGNAIRNSAILPSIGSA